MLNPILLELALHTLKSAADKPKQPPDYQLAPPGVARCASCSHYQQGQNRCTKFKTEVQPEAICGAYEPFQIELPSPTAISPGAGDPERNKDYIRVAAGGGTEVKMSTDQNNQNETGSTDGASTIWGGVDQGPVVAAKLQKPDDTNTGGSGESFNELAKNRDRSPHEYEEEVQGDVNNNPQATGRLFGMIHKAAFWRAYQVIKMAALADREWDWMNQDMTKRMLSGRHGTERIPLQPDQLAASLPREVGEQVAYHGFRGEGNPFQRATSAPGSAMFVSGLPEASMQYVAPGGEHNYLSQLSMPKLRASGSSGPFTQHLATDTRGTFGSLYGKLVNKFPFLGGRIRMPNSVMSHPQYEAVVTQPQTLHPMTQQAFKRLPTGDFMRVVRPRSVKTAARGTIKSVADFDKQAISANWVASAMRRAIDRGVGNERLMRFADKSHTWLYGRNPNPAPTIHDLPGGALGRNARQQMNQPFAKALQSLPTTPSTHPMEPSVKTQLVHPGAAAKLRQAVGSTLTAPLHMIPEHGPAAENTSMHNMGPTRPFTAATPSAYTTMHELGHEATAGKLIPAMESRGMANLFAGRNPRGTYIAEQAANRQVGKNLGAINEVLPGELPTKLTDFNKLRAQQQEGYRLGILGRGLHEWRSRMNTYVGPKEKIIATAMNTIKDSIPYTGPEQAVEGYRRFFPQSPEPPAASQYSKEYPGWMRGLHNKLIERLEPAEQLWSQTLASHVNRPEFADEVRQMAAQGAKK